MIQCIRSSSWTGYILMKVRHDLPEVGFVKVPRDDRGSIRMFVNVSTEHIVEFGQSKASVWLWWNVNSSSSNDRWWKLRGQIEWAADNGESSKWGEQERDRMEIFLGSHHFLLIMKHTPPPLVYRPRLFCPSVKQKTLSDGVTAVSGTEGREPCFSQTRMLQSLMSRWKLVLALRSSIHLILQGLTGSKTRRTTSEISKGNVLGNYSNLGFLRYGTRLILHSWPCYELHASVVLPRNLRCGGRAAADYIARCPSHFGGLWRAA